MTTPTPEDIANAARRQEIGAKFRAEFDAALSLTEEVLGKGWVPTGKHALVSHDEEDAARAEKRSHRPAAVVYTAHKDGKARHFSLIDGKTRECGSYQEGFGPMLTEPDPVRGFTDTAGQFRHVHRYSLYWSSFEPNYRPRSAESLAKARHKRQEKAVLAEADGSLFRDQILAEGHIKRNREGRGR